MSTKSFYSQITPFTNFQGVLEVTNYVEAPEDWWVIITDVQNSTKAVSEGRYKEVNTVGVAAISAVQNAFEGVEFPYIFGGDGATLLLHESQLETARKVLSNLKHLAKAYFDLELRVGLVPIKTVKESGSTVLVARYTMESGSHLAAIRGGGLLVAENLVKSNHHKAEHLLAQNGGVDLTGLSCRWSPLPSLKGNILTILVMAHKPDSKSYTQALNAINDVLGKDLNPVHTSLMHYQTLSQNLKTEWKVTGGKSNSIIKNIGVYFTHLVFKWKVPNPFFSTKSYTDSLPAHSDWRKFDDTLRMVVDCTPSQAAEIESTLERLSDNIAYGLHRSDSALMTCFVKGVSEGNHIHFIDGGNGGYTQAAKQLKKRLKQRAHSLPLAKAG